MARPFANNQRVITATEIRRNFSSVVRRLRKRREHAIIQRSGTLVAVLLSIAEYEQLLRYKRLMVFDKFTREFGQEVERRGIIEEELMAGLEEAKQEVFREQYVQRGVQSND
jgi:prevent-host-death family protein